MSTSHGILPIAFFRDGFVPIEAANISIASSPVLYGLSVYTVLGAVYLAEDNQLAVFRLKDHYERLINSTKIMHFDNFADQWSYKKFEATILKLLAENKTHQNVLIRVMVLVDEIMAGAKMRGLKHSLAAFAFPMTEYHPLSGIKVGVSSWIRTPDNAIPSRAKVNGSYVNISLIRSDILAQGYDDAIILDQQGHVVESTVSNLFLVLNGVLVTPSRSNDLLEGITRDSVITIAKDNGLTVQERDVDRTELYLADEMFVCGSSVRLTPILSVDHRPVGSGQIGPLTKQLSQLYAQAQRGELANYGDWLTWLPDKH